MQHGRQDPPNPEAGKSTDHQIEQSAKYRETCRGNVDCRIPGLPHSDVQKEDSNRKDIVKRLIQRFENHPNRDSSMEDLNKTEDFESVQRKVEGVGHQHGHGILRALRRPLLRHNALIALCIGKRALQTAHAASACSLQKGIDS